MPDKFFAEIANHETPPTYKWFNGSEWVVGTGTTIPVISPIDNSVLGKISEVTHAEIDVALKKAEVAQKEWARKDIMERVKIIHLVGDWIREHEPYMTALLVREIGKPTDEAKDEILRSADMVDYFANDALHLGAESVPSDAFPGYTRGKFMFISRVPLGVILAIAPFNYPVNLSVSKIAPALVTGNAVIFKPPTNGAISGLHLTHIFHKAGVPKDLLVCITGKGESVGDYLVQHPVINMINFTGSSQVGKTAAVKAGMIPLLFECGGNNPALILSDCNVEETATEIVKGAFSFSGQRCTAIKYVLGLSTDIDKILPKVVELTQKKINMGDPRLTTTKSVGPIVTEKAAIEIERRINNAISGGAKLVLGGVRNGNYIEPTILDQVQPTMEIVRIETFGPVVSFIRVNSIPEAISIINSSDYGLQASIYTSDEGTGIKLAEQLEVGSVWINNKPQRGPDHFPFLGIKTSGVGVQGIKYSLEAVTRLKPVIINKPE